MEPFSFASSAVLDFPVCVRMWVYSPVCCFVMKLIIVSNSIEGYQDPVPFSILLKRADLRHQGSIQSQNSELYVTAQIWADCKTLTTQVRTPYKSFKGSRTWNEWLILPVNYSDLPYSAQVVLTVWDVSPVGGNGDHAIPFGGTTVPLFDSDGTLLRGRQRCYVHRRQIGDGLSGTRTPYRSHPTSGPRGKLKQPRDDESIEFERLLDLMRRHEMGEIASIPWLDALVFRQVKQIEQSLARRQHHRTTSTDPSRSAAAGEKVADLPDPGQYTLYIDFPRFDHPVLFADHEYALRRMSASSPDIQLKPPPEVSLDPGINDIDPDAGHLIKIYDPEVGIKDNPVESKHRRLVRSQRTGVLDRDLKPSSKIRDELSHIIAYGPTQDLLAEEKDLVWKYRHHLTRNRRALTKFVKSVLWSDPNEARQAVQLLPTWTDIDVEDALELLGPTFVNPTVRTYAVDRLRKAEDDELLVYLLQLVQALKFETGPTGDVSLARFLISRAVKNFELGNSLHWFLMVECDDQSAGQNPEHGKLFAKVEFDFMSELVKTREGKEQRDVLRRQGELITVLSKISKDVRFSKDDRPRKIEHLKKLVADPKNDFISIDPALPLPLDPSIKIVGCYPEDSNVFKSSLFPLLINFKTQNGSKYPVIFKTGDDLRQDQLVIQIILLMDRLLRKENLDLKLSPYRILATSTTAGAVQFVPSMSLAAIMSATKYKGSLLAYLRAGNNADPLQSLGVRKEVMDTYVKSCAGYCVITYLLGVGDRHLDNLLLAPTGHFFHADFGYILGRDPKPFAPLMKLSKEMIEGMGGAQSAYYQSFRQYCFTAFTTLRKSSGLILNLFSLMVDANIPDIRMEPDKAVGKVKERFHLELRTEEEVIKMFEGLIEDSMSAMFPAIIDWTHGFVQRFRA